jgi:bifunctional DNase/RNase
MTKPIFQTSFQKIVQTNHYTQFILSSKDKRFAIYTAPSAGDYVQRLFTDKPYVRPQTMDLLGSICTSLEITPLQLILDDVKDAIYYCKLFLTQSSKDDQNIIEIDTRPSDGLSLALLYNLPVYCSQNLLDKVDQYEDE